jgi:dUTP pyrophosphatase
MSEELDNDFIKEVEDLESIFGDQEPDYQQIMDVFGVDINELEREMENYEQTMKVEYSHSNKDSIDPSYVYPTDSGFDLYSTEDRIIEPFGRDLIPTGLHIDIPDGYEIQVRSKSGLALKQGLMVLNSPGTVDCFSEDMKVLTIDGEKTIKELKLGDVVYSFNENTMEIEKDTIVINKLQRAPFYKKILQLRTNLLFSNNATFDFYTFDNKNLLGFERSIGTHKLIVIANLSNQNIAGNYPINFVNFINFKNNKKVSADLGFNLAPWDYVILYK